MSSPESQAGRCIAHVDLDGEALMGITPSNRMTWEYAAFPDHLRRAAFYVQVEVRRFPQIKGLPSAVIQVIAFVPFVAFTKLLHFWN